LDPVATKKAGVEMKYRNTYNLSELLHIAILKYCQTKCCGFCCELGGQPGDSESVNSGAGGEGFIGELSTDLGG